MCGYPQTKKTLSPSWSWGRVTWKLWFWVRARCKQQFPYIPNNASQYVFVSINRFLYEWCKSWKQNIKLEECSLQGVMTYDIRGVRIAKYLEFHQWQLTWMSWESDKPTQSREDTDTWNLASRLVRSWTEGEIQRKISEKQKRSFKDSKLCLRRL